MSSTTLSPLTTAATTTTMSAFSRVMEGTQSQLTSPDKIKVLIPQSFNGPFYYPPCKCDMVNQIRYFNPKSRDFYFHGVTPGTMPDLTKNSNILVGEPEFYVYPTPNLASPEVPGLHDYISAYPHHHAVNHMGQYQGPYFPQSSYTPSGPYPVPTVPLESSGICEGVLVSLALLLWLYSFYRLYSAWQRVLNFSEASIQGPQGWDLLVNWIMDRIQKKPSKQTGESGLTDPDAIDVAPIDGLAQIVPSTSQMSSPKSVRSQPSTPMELEDGQALKAAISRHCTQIVRSHASDRHSIALSSSATSTAGSQRKVYESIFSLSDTDQGAGYLSSNPCSVHVLQEGSRPLHAFHRTSQPVTVKRAQRLQKQMSEDLPSYRTTTNTSLMSRRQWGAHRQATTQVVDEEGIGLDSFGISEAYSGDVRKPRHKASRSSIPPLAAVIDMASVEDDPDA